jgi:hypothetical protein
MILEALLLGLVLIALLGYDQHTFAKDLFIYFVWILTIFFSTGYLVTTTVSRLLWRGRTLWPYSVVAAILFLIHFEIMNLDARGAFNPPDRARIRAAGTCIAFFCTLAGSVVLRKWSKIGSKDARN